MKKSICVALLALVCSLTGRATDFVSGGIKYNVTLAAQADSPGMVTVVSNSDLYSGSVVIPSSVTSGDMSYRVTAIAPMAFQNCIHLTGVSIGSNVTTIGYRAFYGCEELEEIDIPDNVQSLAKQNSAYDNSEAFVGCSNLKRVTLGAGLKTMGTAAFRNCPITSLTLKDGCGDIPANTFNGCSKITSVSLPNSVTSIGDNAFQGCIKLTTLAVGDGVTVIGKEAFKGDTHLRSVTLGAQLRTINYQAFANCTDLESIVLPDNLVSLEKQNSAYDNNEAFIGCTSLEDVTIGSKLTSMGTNTFKDCTSLRNVVIKEGCTVIGGGCFYGCGKITGIVLPNTVESIGASAFCNCTALKSIDIPASVTAIGSQAFYGCTSMTQAVVGDGVTSVGAQAFQNCNKLASVKMGADVRTIGYRAFAFCTELSSINLTDQIRTFAVRNGAYNDNEAFAGCTSLTEVVIGRKVESMGTGVFLDCTGLKTVEIHDGCALIGEKCFQGCTSLEEVVIPESVSEIQENAFNGCSALTNATIGDGVTTIGASAFAGCKQMKTLTIGADVRTIKYRAFYGCAALEEVTIPDYCTTLAVQNSAYDNGEQFMDCISLRKVTLGKRITSMAASVFAGCKALEQVIIKDGCAVIGKNCFKGCDNIVTIKNYCTEVPSTADNAFSSYTASLYVPLSSIDDYKAASPWKKFLTIDAIENAPGGDDVRCAKPVIAYAGGQLRLSCATEGASFVTDITDSDIRQFDSDIIDLAVTYVIKAYAVCQGLENSEVTVGTLCWIDAQPSAEGIDADAITEVKAHPVLIQNEGGTLSIQGSEDLGDIAVFDVSGRIVGAAESTTGVATVHTSLRRGDTAIVRIAGRTIKVLLR